MIKFFVRTTGERILDESFSQIEYELLIDTEHKPVKSFIEQLEIINDYDAVLLEDDIQLCRNFKSRIEEVINQYPNEVINFFTFPKCYFKTRREKCFCYNQCTYYPKGLAKKIAAEMRRIENEDPVKHQYDILERMALTKLKISHVQYRPCLVQHLDFKSLIGNKDNSRFCIFYIDYLDDLGISYDKANSKDNVIRLKYKLKKEIEYKINSNNKKG